MAATIEIRSYHGATPDAGTDVAGGTVRFKQADNDTADASNPLPVPGAGTNYSYIKQLKFYASVTPDNVINNMKFYTDGANGYGTDIGLLALTNSGYVDPIDLGAAAGGGVDAFSYTSGSPLTVSGTINNPDTGEFGHYVQIQATVGTTATQGTKPGEIYTFEWDES
ncbi:MAG: hypothetical protein KAJ19_24945 [Gammaproteobacteria bacterium]|nr:hypothetical protein [Gammaproteobacteria bacterium]